MKITYRVHAVRRMFERQITDADVANYFMFASYATLNACPLSRYTRFYQFICIT